MVETEVVSDARHMASTIIHVPRRFVAHEWGGTETVITEIAKQQRAAGLVPRIVTSLALSTQPREVIDGIEVERHRYCYPFLGLTKENIAAMDKKGGNLLSLPLFKSLLQAKDVRLFHAHALKRLGGHVATAARLRRKPFVVSLHGGVFDVPQAETNTMTKPIEGKFEWGRVFGALFRSRTLLDDADMVICVGKSEQIAAQSKLNHDRVAYLPNGVDCDKFSRGVGARFRAKHGIPDSAFVALNISRIDAQKNQLSLVEAFADLHRRDPKAMLVLIGPETQPDYANTLRATIAALGLSAAVKMLPGMRHDDPDLLDAYAACDVFVLPSLHEPFGIVVLEAWSAGKPVIASRVGGLQSLVTDERTGLFIDDTLSLASAFQRLHHDAGLRTTLAEAGAAEARARYDWRRINAQLEDLYARAENHAARRYHQAAAAIGHSRNVASA